MNKNYLIKNIMYLNNNVYIVSVSKNEIAFRAGQCFSLGKPGSGINREYSIYSGQDDSQLEFLIKKVEDGIVSSDLSNLKNNDKIELSGPFGDFCITKENLNKNYLFICTGTGIAPFMSFIKTYKLDHKIIHGIRYEKDSFIHQNLLIDNYIPCVSRENVTKYKRVTDYIKDKKIDENTFIYLCGNRKMITDSVNLLNKKGNYKNIFMEVFF